MTVSTALHPAERDLLQEAFLGVCGWFGSCARLGTVAGLYGPHRGL